MSALRDCIKEFKKAQTPEEKINIIGEIVCNHILHRVVWVDTKLNFVLLFLMLVLTLLGVLIMK